MILDFDEFEEINENLVFIGDEPRQYESAILGLTSDGNHVVYSWERLREAMMKENGWTDEEAEEWISFNTERACEYMGECKPILLNEYMAS